MAPLATVGERFLARLVDSAVLVALDFLMSVALLGGDLSRPGDVPRDRQVLVGVLTFVLYFAYEGAMTAARGQTLGKRCCGYGPRGSATAACPARRAGHAPRCTRCQGCSRRSWSGRSSGC
jgi:hypothetical protein